MTKRIYSVYDVKTGVYGMLMLLLTDGEALRVISDEVNSKDSMLHRHSEDYQLHMMGEFNLNTGEIVTCYPPRHVSDCAQLKEVSK